MFASKNFSLTAPSNNPLGVYTISNSLRFRSSASAYLNRTPTVAGNRRTFTISMWIKRGLLDSSEFTIVSAGNRDPSFQNMFWLNWSPTGQLRFYGDAMTVLTTAVFRDPSAWYHFVVAVDTTQATASDRIKMYVNGSQITSFATANYPGQNFDFNWNNTTFHEINRWSYNQATYGDQYFTEMYNIDGQQLTPSSFGAYNQYGVWQPKKYTGTYGTNGFYLKFNSYATAAALGTDSSGNGNTWTVNNISVTAGATYDSMTDVPTLTSATVANYATLNPLAKYSGVTASNGNLTAVSSTSNQGIASTMYSASGKWYAEFTCNSAGLEDAIGILQSTFDFNVSGFYQATQLIVIRTSSSVFYSSSANIGAPTWTTGDVVQVKLDLDNQTVGWAVNGGSYTTINITSYDSHVAGQLWTFGVKNGSSNNNGNFNYSANFGQRPFSYTPPTGFVALNTYNLSTPTIPNGAAYMAATTYTGTGATLTVANTVNGTAMQPDWVWQKSRSAARDHRLMDTNRGINNVLCSDLTQAEYSGSILSSVNSNGFTLNTADQGNNSGETYVAWQWKANAGTNVSNTSGSITSTVSANTTAGFSIATYTGTGSAATVGHGLGVAPSMVIVKHRNAIDGWVVYHSSLTSAAYYLLLNDTAAQTLNSTVWNSTAPTSSVFSVGTITNTNQSTGTYVAYVFAAVAGYSAFGSYKGNGSTDGPFVYTGFRSRFVMVKASSNSTSSTVWTIWDTRRSPYNASVNELFPNLNAVEGVDSNGIDILSNGFKPKRNSEYANFSGWTYIYMAFAENPFKYALAR